MMTSSWTGSARNEMTHVDSLMSSFDSPSYGRCEEEMEEEEEEEDDDADIELLTTTTFLSVRSLP
jgi:hypothetical protein